MSGVGFPTIIHQQSSLESLKALPFELQEIVISYASTEVFYEIANIDEEGRFSVMQALKRRGEEGYIKYFIRVLEPFCPPEKQEDLRVLRESIENNTLIELTRLLNSKDELEMNNACIAVSRKIGKIFKDVVWPNNPDLAFMREVVEKGDNSVFLKHMFGLEKIYNRIRSLTPCTK